MHFQSSTNVVVGIRKLNTPGQLRLRGLKQDNLSMAVADAIKAVRAISKDLVVLPDTAKYDEITYNYFTELERELRPACYFIPNSVQQVSQLVKAIKPFSHGLNIAIAGAGQQAAAGVANVRDGVTVHLRDLKGIEINEDKQTVSIGAGETMDNVYEKLVDRGLACQGNRHSRGGIGGDALQGGLSFFSYDRGFVCDDVVNFEVVLPSGDVVSANNTTNPDLFSALKGGSNKFGIVTRFDMNIFKQHNMWGGKLFYFQPELPGQIESLVKYLKTPTETNIHLSLSMGYAPAFGKIVCTNDIYSSTPSMPKSLRPFAEIKDELEVMNTLRVHDVKEFADEAFSNARASRVVKQTTTVKADESILNFAGETFSAAFQKLKDTKGLLYSLTFEPIPVSMIEASNAQGENAMGLKPSDGPLVVLMTYTQWDNASDDAKVNAVNQELLNSIEKEAKSKNLDSSYRYLNYASGAQEVYGKEAMHKLRKVSQKYDPDGFFKTNVAGALKL